MSIEEKHLVSTTSSQAAEGQPRFMFQLPSFWPDNPLLWFIQVEAIFAISGITADDSKYCMVISQLASPYVSEVSDIILNPPATDKYIKLKTELIRRFSPSQEKRLRQMLDEQLGDRKPSQLLQRLRNLAGPDFPESFIGALWLSKLPSDVQSVMALFPTTFTETKTNSDITRDINELKEGLAALKLQVEALQKERQTSNCSHSEDITAANTSTNHATDSSQSVLLKPHSQ